MSQLFQSIDYDRPMHAMTGKRRWQMKAHVV
jgi:hypothetical protein